VPVLFDLGVVVRAGEIVTLVGATAQARPADLARRPDHASRRRRSASDATSSPSIRTPPGTCTTMWAGGTSGAPSTCIVVNVGVLDGRGALDQICPSPTARCTLTCRTFAWAPAPSALPQRHSRSTSSEGRWHHGKAGTFYGWFYAPTTRERIFICTGTRDREAARTYLRKVERDAFEAHASGRAPSYTRAHTVASALDYFVSIGMQRRRYPDDRDVREESRPQAIASGNVFAAASGRGGARVSSSSPRSRRGAAAACPRSRSPVAARPPPSARRARARSPTRR
jgi:hypothetical protein